MTDYNMNLLVLLVIVVSVIIGLMIVWLKRTADERELLEYVQWLVEQGDDLSTDE